jgi:hypothetical protein
MFTIIIMLTSCNIILATLLAEPMMLIKNYKSQFVYLCLRVLVKDTDLVLTLK